MIGFKESLDQCVKLEHDAHAIAVETRANGLEKRHTRKRKVILLFGSIRMFEMILIFIAGMVAGAIFTGIWFLRKIVGE
jgi:hypothetical protein